MDARSGIFVGCHVADTNSSQNVLTALRRGILRYGIPDNIYVDNGREYLNKDVGGTGHRTRKTKNEWQAGMTPRNLCRRPCLRGWALK